ncbi:MAG: tetraacyldisaccharide 4'-kinase [Bacteroidales bacterium]
MLADKILLAPYYLILYIRNKFYDKGWKKSYEFETPIICVGNITVGGTGKTPHIEMLIRMFQTEKRVAVISRGYKRKTKSYLEVNIDMTSSDCGDEPLQIKKKFPNVRVVVDSNRKRAIEKFEALDKNERPELILLDDAYQYRRVKPSKTLLLVNYSRPIWKDYLLPLGRLRDLFSQVSRADAVIVTKVIDDIDISVRRRWRKNLRLREEQVLFFSKIVYNTVNPVFNKECDQRYTYAKSAIAFSAIANNNAFNFNLSEKYQILDSIKFIDHHDFTKSDIRKISKMCRKNPISALITTEKDAQRLYSKNLPKEIKSRLFYFPIEVEIMPVVNEKDNLVEEEIREKGKQELKDYLCKR